MSERDAELGIAEIETVRLILARNRVLPRDNRRRLPDLPTGFFAAVAAHLHDDRDADVVIAHLKYALRHHGISPHTGRVDAAVVELLRDSAGWGPRELLPTRVESITRWGGHRSRRMDHLGRVVESELGRGQQLDDIVAEYEPLVAGSAFHDQDSGWRLAVDVLMERIRAAATPDPGRTPEEARVHADFEALATRQLAYPFLGAWRLYLEIQLKELVAALREALPTSTAAAVSRNTVKAHRLMPLWEGVSGALPELASKVEQRLGMSGTEASEIHTQLDPTAHERSLRELEDIDPDGQTLRYRTSLDKQQNMAYVHRIELSRLHADLESVDFFLNRLSQYASAVAGLDRCDRRIADLEAGKPMYPINWLE